MKKIMLLSIGLLCSSVQATNFNQADIAHVAAELVKNPEFMARVGALYKQGLTAEQIAEQLVQSVHELSDCRFEPMGSGPSLFGLIAFPIVLMMVGYVGLVISSCCEELMKEEKKAKE